ncbi:MAG: hypothetical protein ABIG63_21610 [Chloroflexota bacterium]
MNAQFMYDFRSKWEFCSGSELADFFRATTGEPSPSGSKEIKADEARRFIHNSLLKMEQRSPSTKQHCQAALREIPAR